MEAEDVRKTAVAVVRAWAAIFKGGHAFKIVGIIGASLDIYADMLARSMGDSDLHSEVNLQFQSRS